VKTIRDLYNNPTNLVSFEGLKEALKGYNCRILCFVKGRVYVKFLKRKGERQIKIKTDVLREVIKIEEQLKLYYHRCDVYISEDQLNFYVEC